jgi:hypothetical protein
LKIIENWKKALDQHKISFIKILKSTGSKIDPWGTPL